MAIIPMEQYFDFAFQLAGQFYTLNLGSVTMTAHKTEITRQEVLAKVTV